MKYFIIRNTPNLCNHSTDFCITDVCIRDGENGHGQEYQFVHALDSTDFSSGTKMYDVPFNWQRCQWNGWRFSACRLLYTIRKIDTQSKYRSQVNWFRRKCAANWLHTDGIIFSLTSKNYLSSDLEVRNCAWLIRSRSTVLIGKLLLHVHHIHHQSIPRRSSLRIRESADNRSRAPIEWNLYALFFYLLWPIAIASQSIEKKNYSFMSIAQFKQNRD